MPFGSQCQGSCLWQRCFAVCQIAARTRDYAGLEVAREQHQGHGGAHGCRLGLNKSGHPLQHRGGNPTLCNRPWGPGSPVQESQSGEHRLVAPFFRGNFIPEESNAARGIKIAA